MSKAVWGDDAGITWAGASEDVREEFALARLFWFFRMVDSGGPDGSELDTLVYDEAREAAEWFGPILHARANAASVSGGQDQ